MVLSVVQAVFLMNFFFLYAIIFAKTWVDPESWFYILVMKGAYGEKRYNYRDIWG